MAVSMSVPPTMATAPVLRIAVVDDDLPLLDALERGLLDAGEHHVVALSKFEDAKQMLRSTPFNVLITDVRLGAFNGLQLAVLAKDVNPDLTLIVFSGYDDPVLREEAERLGGTYLIKPVLTSELLAVIRSKTNSSSDAR